MIDRREEFSIESDHAFVACAQSMCVRCRTRIELIMLYCARGHVDGEALEAFCVHDVWELDEALAAQLARWPFYRLDVAGSTYLNHCPRCGAAQPESDLYEEAGQPFHGMPACVTRPVRFLPLAAHVRLNGEVAVDV